MLPGRCPRCRTELPRRDHLALVWMLSIPCPSCQRLISLKDRSGVYLLAMFASMGTAFGLGLAVSFFVDAMLGAFVGAAAWCFVWCAVVARTGVFVRSRER